MARLALVVDDSMVIRHLLQRFLQESGFTVQTVSNGAEALKALETLRPQVIFTDLQMPRLDGHQLIEIIKGTPEISRIPIVVLAANPLSEAQSAPLTPFVVAKDLNIESQLRQILEELRPLLAGAQRNTKEASAENSAEAKSPKTHLG